MNLFTKRNFVEPICVNWIITYRIWIVNLIILWKLLSFVIVVMSIFLSYLLFFWPECLLLNMFLVEYLSFTLSLKNCNIFILQTPFSNWYYTFSDNCDNLRNILFWRPWYSFSSADIKSKLYINIRCLILICFINAAKIKWVDGFHDIIKDLKNTSEAYYLKTRRSPKIVWCIIW